MATLADTEFRTVIEDARARHAAVVALIYTTDTQAMALLRLYVTLGIAAASGAAAGFGASAAITRPAAWALVVGAVIFVIGAGLCLRALRSAAINLPGRKPDFWEWAMLPNIDRAAVLAAYLDNLKVKGIANDRCNASSATALKWAKRCGAVAPLGALLAAAAVHVGGL